MTVDRQSLRSDGLAIYASSEEPPDPTKLPALIDECVVMWRSWFDRDYSCGHRDGWRFRVSMFGLESYVIRQKQYCPICWIRHEKKHIIFCALCGLPIFPDWKVALYDDDNDGILPVAHHLGDYVIGCPRQDCCYDVNLRGWWTHQGFIEFSADQGG